MKRFLVVFASIAIALAGCSSGGSYRGGGIGPTPRVEITVEDYDQGVETPPILLGPGPTELLYPREMLRCGIEGTAVIKGTVDGSGVLRSVAGIEATHASFLDAATNGWRLWRFTPAKRGGSPVSCAITCKVRFALEH